MCRPAEGGARLVPIDTPDHLLRQQQLFGVDFRPVRRSGARGAGPAGRLRFPEGWKRLGHSPGGGGGRTWELGWGFWVPSSEERAL